MKTSANIAANFVSKIWSFLSLYLFSRLFVNLLGIDLYGIISFYTLLFGIAGFADAGLSATLNREFAKGHHDGFLKRLLRFFENIYIAICFLISVFIFIFSDTISIHWLSSNSLPQGELEWYVRLIGIAIGTQLVSSIYFGALMGRQMQVWANGIQVLFSILRTVGGVFLLYLFHKNLPLFFFWQILCNISQAIVLRQRLIKDIKAGSGLPSLTIYEISPELWKFMGGMTVIAILSSLTIQSDKLVASKFLSLSNFAYYSLASALSQASVLIVTPIVLAIFPLLVRNYSAGSMKKTYHIYELVSLCVSVIVLPVCMVLCFYGDQIFQIWLSSKNMRAAPEGISYLIVFLVLGNTFQALQFMPFYLLMTQGKTKFTVYQLIAELSFLIPALYFFVNKYGLIGMGVPWFIVKLAGYLYLCLIVEKLKPEEIKINYRKIILSPGFVTAIIGIGFYLIFRSDQPVPFKTITSCFLIIMISVLVNLYLYDKSFQSFSYLKKRIKI